MKKFCISISLLLFAFSISQAQNYNVVKQITSDQLTFVYPDSRLFYDTLIPASLQHLGQGLCGDTINVYSLPSPQHGYIGGNNSNGDKEIFQKFGITGSAGVYSILGMFGKKSNASNSMMVGNLYDLNPVTHAPDSLLFFTDPTSLADVDTFWHIFTTYQFPGEIPVYDSFAVSIELPTGAGDTAAIFMTPLNCYSGYQQSFIRKSNNTVVPLNAGGGTYQINADFWIWAVVIPDTSVNSSVSLKDITLFAAYPNPASHELNVNFSNHLPSDISVQFVNDLGQIVKTISLGHHMSGRYSENIDVSDLAAGSYYYSIITETERIFSRVTIAK